MVSGVEYSTETIFCFHNRISYEEGIRCLADSQEKGGVRLWNIMRDWEEN